ncbi:MAG TPA: DUF3352 domain-containing protein [Candidatus Limnocylindrales bacterium]
MTDFDRSTHSTETSADSTSTDTTATPVPTTSIQAPPPAGAAPRQSRARWLAAGVLIAIVVGVTGLATLVLTSSQTTSAVLGYVPTDSVAYGEVRLDLPGDQRQEVGEFLSKFPGFADQAALETKLDEVLDRLVSEGSNGKQTYTKDVKPWFSGQMGFALGPIPTRSGEPTAKDGRGVVMLSIKDPALARTWLTNTLQEEGVSSRSETYNGSELTLFSSPKAPDVEAAFTIAGDKVAIVGDTASVKAAVDTKGSSSLAKGDAVTAAQAALTGDDLGFMFLDVKSLFEATTELAGSVTEAGGSVPPIPDSLARLLPDWTAMRMRVEGDAVRLDSVTQHKEGTPGPDENRTNGVARFAPPSTIALASGNDYGATLLEWVKLYRDEPSLKDAFTKIDQAAGMLGGLDALLGWMGDTGIVVAKDGDTVEGGLVSIPADAAQGRQLLTTLRSFVQLSGGQGSGITVTDETYDGETITVVDLGDLSGLAGMAGAMGGVPVQPSGLPDAEVKLAYVANDQVIAIGSSPDFIKQVLDAGAGTSLADEGRFTGLIGRVDAQHTGVTFVDLTAIRGLVEASMADAPADKKAEYEESVKPFLTPFDALIATGAVGGSNDQIHTVITVK